MLNFFIWMIRTMPIHQVFFFFKGLTTNTIKPLVFPFINITRIKSFLQNFLHEFFMIFRSGSYKIGITNTNSIPNRTMFSCHHIRIFHRLHSLFLSGFYDFLRIFINPRRETNIFPLKSLIFGDSVSQK